MQEHESSEFEGDGAKPRRKEGASKDGREVVRRSSLSTGITTYTKGMSYTSMPQRQ